MRTMACGARIVSQTTSGQATHRKREFNYRNSEAENAGARASKELGRSTAAIPHGRGTLQGRDVITRRCHGGVRLQPPFSAYLGTRRLIVA